MLGEKEIESCYLGQFIPVHYHHNMLMDDNRMGHFKAAIEYAVRPGAKVLELGGGTGVLSWFAAAKADKVWCVEFNPDMVEVARHTLARNPNGHKVEVVHADAFTYLPPEPVDVVICEMIHVAMLREKQVQVIEAFKQRYLERFGGPLPVFVPGAILMAVQPVQQNHHFHGYYAPIVQFQDVARPAEHTVELAQPALYSVMDFNETVSTHVRWAGEFAMHTTGTVTALRFITKNVLAVVTEQAATIDWCIHPMTLPLAEPVDVVRGDILNVGFHYQTGGSIPSLQATLSAQKQHGAHATAPRRRHSNTHSSDLRLASAVS